MVNRYKPPHPFSYRDVADYHAAVDWQNAELSSEDDRLNAEDDRPTDSQARAAGGVEAWYKQRDEHRKENRDARPT